MARLLQIFLLTLVIVGSAGVLWWRLQPPPPLPLPPSPPAPAKATGGKPLTSALLPVTFMYPAAREQGYIDRFDFFGPCIGAKEVFFWEYEEVLKQAGAPDKIVDLKLSPDPVEQTKQQSLIKRRDAYLDKVFGLLILGFYKQLREQGATVVTSSLTLPDNMGEVKTWGHSDTNGFITYKGNHYGSYFKNYPLPGSTYPNVFALTLCQVSQSSR